MARPSHMVVDLAALISNYQWACQLAPQAKTMAVVKANAYGHGAVACAQALEPYAPAFGVACIEEAITLREGGINKPILLLEGTFTADEVAIAAQQNFWLMVEDPLQVDAILTATVIKPLTVWVKVDSGMHRLGLNPNRVNNYYQQLLASPNVCNDMVFATHFASADETNNNFTLAQVKQFKATADHFEHPTSLANSAAIMAWPEAHAHWNRAGFMLYGNSPLDAQHPSSKGLQPVMQVRSAIISLRQIETGASVGYAQQWRAARPSIIATVAIGYGDGYPRSAATGTPVVVNGQRASIVGRVSMDMITIDVTDLEGIHVGDQVCLWGKGLSINEVAQHAGTIGYELMTRVTQRLPIFYKQD
ncbi:MAG: alanine racemase [Gammaproteobacteria bacterium]|nr:alanine racemase [Gammaproteobacteria bacterium]